MNAPLISSFHAANWWVYMDRFPLLGVRRSDIYQQIDFFKSLFRLDVDTEADEGQELFHVVNATFVSSFLLMVSWVSFFFIFLFFYDFAYCIGLYFFFSLLIPFSEHRKRFIFSSLILCLCSVGFSYELYWFEQTWRAKIGKAGGAYFLIPLVFGVHSLTMLDCCFRTLKLSTCGALLFGCIRWYSFGLIFQIEWETLYVPSSWMDSVGVCSSLSLSFFWFACSFAAFFFFFFGGCSQISIQSESGSQRVSGDEEMIFLKKSPWNSGHPIPLSFAPVEVWEYYTFVFLFFRCTKGSKIEWIERLHSFLHLFFS